MRPVSRIGDIAVGVCYCHKNPVYWVGNIVSGASRVKACGSSIARIGDTVVGCHSAKIITGSSTVIAEGCGVARIFDNVSSGCVTGRIISGCETVISG